MRPAVSIILPVFNRLTFLRAAIESVFAQSFADWELLIADDGSEPQTQDYLRTLEKSPRVKILRLVHSGKPAAVRNAACSEATGEYIAFLDSDDLWSPDKLKIQIASLRSRIDCQWSFTGFTLVDDRGNPLAGRQTIRRPSPRVRILDQLLTEAALVVTPSVVVRRETLTKVGGYRDELLVCEDFELWVRLAACSEADFIDQPLVLVRRHTEHSFDDVTCLENLMRVLDIVKQSGVAPHLDAALDGRRAGTSAALAAAHALRKTRFQMILTLLSGVRYFWRYPHWWLGGMAAVVRAFAPPKVLDLVRQYRVGRRSRLERRDAAR